MESKERSENIFHYRLVINSLLYLIEYTRLDISIVVHYAAKFSNCLKDCHDTVVKQISKYLLETLEEGLIYQLDISKGLEIFVNANFTSTFDKLIAEDPTSMYLRTGHIIKYTGCLII